MNLKKWTLCFLLLPVLSNAQIDPGMIKKALTVITEPAGAQVYLKEKGQWVLLGKAPGPYEIKIGEKEIKIILEKYQEVIQKIDTQHSGKIKVKLKPVVYVSLKVQTKPKEALIFLNDGLRGKSGETIENLPLGNYQLTVKKFGFEPIRTQIELKKQKLYDFQYVLTAKEPGEFRILEQSSQEPDWLTLYEKPTLLNQEILFVVRGLSRFKDTAGEDCVLKASLTVRGHKIKKIEDYWVHIARQEKKDLWKEPVYFYYGLFKIPFNPATKALLMQ